MSGQAAGSSMGRGGGGGGGGGKEAIQRARANIALVRRAPMKAIALAALLLLLNIAQCASRACKEGDAAVQNEKPLESNGCSKPSFLQVHGEEDFSYCCDRHDACYETCGMAKATCDKEFSKCMKNMCSSSFRSNPDCSSAAETYYMGTAMFGDVGYEESQQTHCKCIKQELVPEHYTQLVHAFYKAWAPPHKLQAFVASDKMKSKYIDAKSINWNKPNFSKLHRLFLELHKTYDQAIRHTGERVGKAIVKPASKDEL